METVFIPKQQGYIIIFQGRVSSEHIRSTWMDREGEGGRGQVDIDCTTNNTVQ